MPYQPHARLVWGGTYTDVGTDIEVWSCSLALFLAGQIGGDQQPDDTKLDAIASAVETFVSGDMNGLVGQHKLRFVKVNGIGIDGKYADPNNTRERNPVGVQGSGAFAGVPLSNALRITLDDGGRNRRHKGGWYHPFLGAGVGTDGRHSAAHATALAGHVNTFLNSLQAAGAEPIIASQYGDLTGISRVRVGTAPDTQRRRDNALLEQYVEVTRTPASGQF